VTLVAVDAVVDVPAHTLVILICLALGMAIGALENGIIVRIDMARRTHSIGVAMIRRKWRVLRVIKRGVEPIRRVVAGLARSREELRLRGMSRVRSVVVIGLVAPDARRRQRRVVVVYMTIRA